jgi:hypothetical protein
MLPPRNLPPAAAAMNAAAACPACCALPPPPPRPPLAPVSAARHSLRDAKRALCASAPHGRPPSHRSFAAISFSTSSISCCSCASASAAAGAGATSAIAFMNAARCAASPNLAKRLEQILNNDSVGLQHTAARVAWLGRGRDQFAPVQRALITLCGTGDEAANRTWMMNITGPPSRAALERQGPRRAVRRLEECRRVSFGSCFLLRVGDELE